MGTLSPSYNRLARHWIIPYVRGDRISKGVGYTDDGDGNRQWYSEKMDWELKSNVWRPARWKWTECEPSWEPRYRASFIEELILDFTIGAQAGSILPDELFLHVVEQFTKDDPAGGALRNLALVCRAWFTRCVARLYHKITVDVSRVDELHLCLCKPNNHISAHAQWLVVRGHRGWAAAAKLLPFLPHLETLEFSEPDSKTWNDPAPPPYHPSMPRMTAGAYASLVRRWNLKIESLWFRHCNFSSPDDLFHLIASFPSLRKLHLMRISFGSKKCPIVRARCTELALMTVMYCSTIWPFPYLWTWPHPPTCPGATSFPGLAVRDARVASAILKYIREPDDWIVGQMDKLIHPKAWTAVICGLYFDFEFHAYSSNDAAFAEIRYVFLRFTQRFLITNLMDKYDGLDGIAIELATLHGLEAVIIEAREPFEAKVLAARMAAVRSKLQWMTFREAQETALGSLNNDQMSEHFPVSPIWYDPRQEFRRDHWPVVVEDDSDREDWEHEERQEERRLLLMERRKQLISRRLSLLDRRGRLVNRRDRLWPPDDIVPSQSDPESLQKLRERKEELKKQLAELNGEIEAFDVQAREYEALVAEFNEI